MSFLLSIKQKCQRTKFMSGFLLNIYQIQLIAVLLINLNTVFYQNAFQIVNYYLNVNHELILFIALAVNILMTFTIILMNKIHNSSMLYSKILQEVSIWFIKIFYFVAFIPLVSYNLDAVKNGQIITKILAIINILFCIVYTQINEISNWSYRFKEADYCNRRSSNQVNIIIELAYLAVLKYFTSQYASIILLVRALLKLLTICKKSQFKLIQEVDTFYGLYQIFIVNICLISNLGSTKILNSIVELSFLLIVGAFVCYTCIQPLVNYINYSMIEKSKNLNLSDQDQGDITNQNQKKIIQNFQNQIRMMTNIYLQRQKMIEQQPNEYSQWWQIFNRRILIHKIKCKNTKCVCQKTSQTDIYRNQTATYIGELLSDCDIICRQNSKRKNLKVMSIYLFIEIAKKPLKAYYQIMKLKSQKVDETTKIQLEDLVKETRECFDQVFLKSKAQNQQLQLMKVIQYEELVTSTQKLLQKISQSTISFHELFLYHTIKIQNVKRESVKLFEMKAEIQKKIQHIILNFSQNNKLAVIIYVFYKYIQVYKSRQSEFKKISSQQNLRKRIYHKNEVNIFSSSFGSIYIDLINQRGKIMNLTRNMCDAFLYSREDMIGFNINRFMPTIFGKHHARFLSNFIQKGKIKLLRQKQRVIFAKNKKKFIFPVNVRLKAEYLLENQFGASSLINGVETNSQFMLVGNNGKLQEITQNLYKKLFLKSFRDEVGKCNRLCVFKMLPSYNIKYEAKETISPNKIYEGILIYSESDEYLNQKFRYARDMTVSGASLTGSKSNTGSKSASKMSIMSNSNSISGFMQKGQIIQFLAQTFKSFLIDINIFRLKGFKVTYKFSPIVTAQFTLDLIEFLTVQPVQGMSLYRGILDELCNVAQIYEIFQQHSPLAKHLQEIEQIIKQNKVEENMRYITLDKNSPSIQGSPRQDHQLNMLKRQSHEYKVDRTTPFIEVLDDQSDDQFRNDDNNKDIQINYEQSQQSSMIGNMESQSKKQILINAFNSKKSMVSSQVLVFINVFVVALLTFLVLLAIFSIEYIQNTSNLWEDSKFVHTVIQSYEFKLALIQIEKFQYNTNSVISDFVSAQKDLINNQFKQILFDMTSMTENNGIKEQFYLQTFTISNGLSSQQISIPSILSILEWKFTYEKQNSTATAQILRNFYQSLHIQLESFLNNEQQNILSKSNSYALIVIFILGGYLVSLFVLGISILPIYSYYKNKEINVTSLLAYMNVKQIKKSIKKLKLVRQTLKIEEKNIQSFQANVIQGSQKRHQNQEQDMQNGVRSLKITNQQTQSCLLVSKKSLLLLIVFLVFFLNFAICSIIITTETKSFFETTLNANMLSQQLQNKNPLVINIYLSNVNRFLSNQTIVSYSDSIYNQAQQGYFKITNELSSSRLGSSSVASILNQDLSASTCNIINCQSNNNTKTISFQYLTYQFKNRFDYFAPSNGVVLSANTVQSWIDKNNVDDLLLWMEQIIKYSDQINRQVDTLFKSYNKNNIIILALVAALLIPLNFFIIIYIQRKFLEFLNKMLTQSQEVFRHFNVNVLVQNTYLTSYFNSKIKEKN